MQLMNCSLEKRVKDLSDDDFKNLELFKQNNAYPYEYMDSFKKFSDEKWLDKRWNN